jgi:NADH-quinone oxidoreductase E subunit
MSQPLSDLNPQAEAMMSRYEYKKAAMLPLLHLVQDHLGYITTAGEEWVAAHVGLSLAHVQEVVSFYTLYRRTPAGKYRIQVCANISCWLRGCDKIVKHLEDKLAIAVGETTPDGKFSLSTVECLCACEVAPMLQLNDDYIGNLTPEGIDHMLEECT